jgi:hypothetical protein
VASLPLQEGLDDVMDLVARPGSADGAMVLNDIVDPMLAVHSGDPAPEAGSLGDVLPSLTQRGLDP